MTSRSDILSIISLIAAVLFNAVPRWLLNHYGYYPGQAISILLFTIPILLPSKNRFVKIITQSVLCLEVSNIGDELLGRPTEFEFAEKVFGLSILLWTVYRIKRNWKTV